MIQSDVNRKSVLQGVTKEGYAVYSFLQELPNQTNILGRGVVVSSWVGEQNNVFYYMNVTPAGSEEITTGVIVINEEHQLLEHLGYMWERSGKLPILSPYDLMNHSLYN